MPSKELLRQLRRHEGLGPVRYGRTYVYRCTAGARTVGYGRNIDANPLNSVEQISTKWNGDSITLEGAEWLLVVDAERVENQVRAKLPWASKLWPARFDVLVNMAFQMGIGGLLGFSNTLRLIRIGAYSVAAAAMLQSKWARQTPDRARELAEQMKSGVYRDSA